MRRLKAKGEEVRPTRPDLILQAGLPLRSGLIVVQYGDCYGQFNFAPLRTFELLRHIVCSRVHSISKCDMPAMSMASPWRFRQVRRLYVNQPRRPPMPSSADYREVSIKEMTRLLGRHRLPCRSLFLGSSQIDIKRHENQSRKPNRKPCGHGAETAANRWDRSLLCSLRQGLGTIHSRPLVG